MKTLMVSFMAGILIFGIFGCGTAMKEIQRRSQSERTDVFTEINEDIPPVHQGGSTLTIKASIKTELEGAYVFESRDSVHGKKYYPFLINVDGQSETWKVEGKKDSLPLYDKDGKPSRNPDAGVGIKYVLVKKIHLLTGTHKVFIGLPGDDYFKEVEIILKEGDPATLEFKPIYKYKTFPLRIPNFMRGIERYETTMNNTHIYSGKVLHQFFTYNLKYLKYGITYQCLEDLDVYLLKRVYI